DREAAGGCAGQGSAAPQAGGRQAGRAGRLLQQVAGDGRSPAGAAAAGAGAERAVGAHAAPRAAQVLGPERAPLAGAAPLEVVAQDGAVVEAELRPRHFLFREPARLGRVVGALRLRARAGGAGVDGADVVLAR